ncbi:MAG: polysaccharide deacetylase family protein [Candidatus Pseudobacter hemicellulosilyticus]|uniref:Polysaccharide deacetylase family protein n=1 Tax=Candidatus Pseudobacter hemicellulosilyticus TaxID=3121375 RepID=A0AAJ5WUZ1_9BACT|nr:MAG: polysaccharide deacetylase family protein [Pseudobacter sp.]
MLLLYTHTATPRLQYIVDFFSRELFDEPMQITTSRAAYNAATQPKINYSSQRFSEGGFFIHHADLLFETDIRPQSIRCFEQDNNKAFFPTDGDFPFDIFAASFYLISRYEEYLPHEKDMYGRYAHTNSLAWREGFLHLPLVSIWVENFRKALLHKFPALQFRRKNFKCMLSYDIDMAYAFRYKGFKRTVGGFARSMLRGNWRECKDRWQVLRGRQQDPFDCFEWLDALHLYCRLKPYYFFLVAARPGIYDKNISQQVKPFQKLIEYYASSYKVGLHPSWQSGDKPELLQEELEWIERVADKAIIHSRQHYIRFTLPETFQRLVDTGIQKDFSMGYGSINGFRASVCSSFYWYDLQQETSTPLILYPFSFMDANAYYEQHNTPEQAYGELKQQYEQVKKLNGMHISIWHNSILGTDPTFAGWRQLFELFMRETVYWDAYYD